MREGAVVLITGASSGFGEAAAKLLASRGLNVFGTSRRAGDGVTGEGFAMVRLDVRSDESVAACVDEVMRRAGRIDALVNNAGYTLAGAMEETSLAEAIRSLGYGPYTPKEMIDMSVNGVSAEFFEALREYGIKQVDARDAVRARQHGVNRKSLAEARQYGPSLTIAQIIKLKSAGVI